MGINGYIVKDIDVILNEYKAISKDILRNLEIQYVQQKIRRKIWKDESSEIELIFLKNEQIEDTTLEDMTTLLSESNEENDRDINSECSIEANTIENSKGIFENFKNDNINIEKFNHSEALQTKYNPDCMQNDQKLNFTNHNKLLQSNHEPYSIPSHNISSQVETKKIDKKHKKRFLSKFIDIEAECSDDKANESEEDDEFEMDDIVDTDEEENAMKSRLGIFYENIEKEDKDKLKKLKSKFLTYNKKKSVNTADEINNKGYEIIDSDFEMPEIEEINLDRLEFTDLDDFNDLDTKKCIYDRFEKFNNPNFTEYNSCINNENIYSIDNKEIDNNDELFADDKLALERLMKKEDKYSSGFFKNN